MKRNQKVCFNYVKLITTSLLIIYIILINFVVSPAPRLGEKECACYLSVDCTFIESVNGTRTVCELPTLLLHYVVVNFFVFLSLITMICVYAALEEWVEWIQDR